MHLRRLLEYVDFSRYLAWTILASWKNPEVNLCCFNCVYYEYTEIPLLSSEAMPCFYKLVMHWGARNYRSVICFYWSLSGLLWEAPQMHRFFHFLGLNVPVSVQNQLFKHHVECVFSSFLHCLSHCVLHYVYLPCFLPVMLLLCSAVW